MPYCTFDREDLAGFFHAVTDLFPGAKCYANHVLVDLPGQVYDAEAVIGNYRIGLDAEGITLRLGNSSKAGISSTPDESFVVDDWTLLRDGFLTNCWSEIMSDLKWTARDMGSALSEIEQDIPRLPRVVTDTTEFLSGDGGSIIFIAGGRGNGKTSLAMELAADATKHDRPVFYYSDEGRFDLKYTAGKWGAEVVKRNVFYLDPVYRPPGDALAHLEKMLRGMPPMVVIIESASMQQTFLSTGHFKTLVDRVPQHHYVFVVPRRLKETTDRKARSTWFESDPVAYADVAIWCDGPWHPYRVHKNTLGDIGRVRLTRT